MDDLISRQAAIEVVCEALYTPIPCYGNDLLQDCMTLAKSIVKNLPSAEPERKWIPVTERLPEEETDVLVSVHFEGFKGKTVDLPPSDYVEIASHVDGVWSSLSDEYKVAWKKHHVVAWMPTPDPYRGNE